MKPDPDEKKLSFCNIHASVHNVITGRFACLLFEHQIIQVVVEITGIHLRYRSHNSKKSVIVFTCVHIHILITFLFE